MKILLVDDHKVFLASFHLLIKQEFPLAVIYKATNGLEAIEMVKASPPDVILLDINMPIMNGFQVAEYVTVHFPAVKIIMLTNVNGKAMVLNLATIVHGFLFKDIDGEEIKKAVEAVLRNEKYFCAKSHSMLVNNLGTIEKLPYINLDKREANIVELMASGLTSKEMSVRLGVREKIINRYREDLLKKTKTKSATELIAYAFHNGLISI